MNLCYSPKNTLSICIAILVALPYILKRQLYLGIRDGATGACYAEPMSTKSQTIDTFRKFICRVERQSGEKLKNLRTEFGEESVN